MKKIFGCIDYTQKTDLSAGCSGSDENIRLQQPEYDPLIHYA